MGKIQTLYGNTLIVKVFPRSKVSRIEEMLDDGTLKVRLRSPPEGGQANEELLLLLEKTTGEKWKILRGKTMHRKHVGKIL